MAAIQGLVVLHSTTRDLWDGIERIRHAEGPPGLGGRGASLLELPDIDAVPRGIIRWGGSGLPAQQLRLWTAA